MIAGSPGKKIQKTKKLWCVAFADFLGKNSPAMVNFKLLSWGHWTQTGKKCALAHSYIVEKN